MFRVGSAAIFLVNRPCAVRHCPAKTVIAGFGDARHANCPRFTGFATIAAQQITVISGLDPAIHREMEQPAQG